MATNPYAANAATTKSSNERAPVTKPPCPLRDFGPPPAVSAATCAVGVAVTGSVRRGCGPVGAQQPLPRRVWIPSRAASPAMTRATNGSGRSGLVRFGSARQRTHAACFGGPVGKPLVRRIVHADQPQTVRRSHRTAAFLIGQYLRGPTDSPTPVPSHQQRSDEATHHRVTERVSRKVRDQEVFVAALPGHRPQLANRRGSRTLFAE